MKKSITLASAAAAVAGVTLALVPALPAAASVRLISNGMALKN